MYKYWKILGVLSAVAVFSATEANAFHHRHGGWGSSGGSWGSYGSSGGSWGSYGSSGGSSGGWGSSGGHHYRSWGSSGGSSGGWGSSGGSSGGYVVHHGSSGGSSGGSNGGHYMPSAPAQPMQPAMPPMPDQPGPAPIDALPGDAPAPAPAADGTTYHPTYGPVRTAATVSVSVPANAKIFVNGLATTSIGAERQYVSRGLRAGAKYSYTVRAEIVRDGKTVTETQTVQLKAGETANLAFSFSGNAEEGTAAGPVKTKLTLNVPAEAKVFLSGQQMNMTGDIREFTTTQLNAGEEWSDYTVRVELNRDGQIVSKDQTITLKAGDDRELSFDFDSAQVASNPR